MWIYILQSQTNMVDDKIIFILKINQTLSILDVNYQWVDN